MTDPLQQETTDVLTRLIRHDTVNPPGNERVLQEELAAYLQAAGLEGFAVRHRADLAVCVLRGQPDFKVIGLGRAKAHVPGAQ